jgi:hypothetical protein
VTIKSNGNVVVCHKVNVCGAGELPAVSTTDAIDGTELSAIGFSDSDVSIYLGGRMPENECVLSKEQAREFFTKALELCK